MYIRVIGKETQVANTDIEMLNPISTWGKYKLKY